MSYSDWTNLIVDELYLAGERVSAGLYREIATGREIRLDREDYLPATHDGRVAAYACVRYTWEQNQEAIEPALSAPKARDPFLQPANALSPKISLLLVGNNGPWRDAVHHAVEHSEFEILAEAGSRAQALDRMMQAKPDIVLLDVGTPGRDGLEPFYALRSSRPQMRLILMTCALDPLWMVDALASGASACLSLKTDPEELLYALRAVCCGARVIAG